MNMPGFTAEMSLYKTNEHYQATTDVSHYDGIVQPAISIIDLVGLKFCWNPICKRIPDGTGGYFLWCFCP
jgi:hypothetical protein